MALPAQADDVRPVQVHVKEREPGAYLVQWRVPQIIPFRAMPTPVMPQHCRTDGERAVLTQSGSWLLRQAYRCTESLAGQEVGIRYPVPNPSITTVIRLELLSGDRFAHALPATEDSWRVPLTGVGTLETLLLNTRRSVLAGANHIFGHWIHAVFLVSLVLLGGWLGSVRLVSAFAVGQIGAVLGTAVLRSRFDPVLAEVCVAIAVAFLAREALRGDSPSHRVVGLAASAGIFHGLSVAALVPSTGATQATWLSPLLIILGMDAVLLLLAIGVSGLVRLGKERWPLARLRPVVTYAVGGTAIAAGLTLALGGGGSNATERNVTARLPGLGPSSSSVATPGSRRVAAQAVGAPVQSFLAIDPFEIRHEVLVRLIDVADVIPLDVTRGEHIDIERQGVLARRIGEFVSARTAIEIDGQLASGQIARVDWVTVGPQGVLPRTTPMREAVGEAVVGVTVVYLTNGVPDDVTLAWSGSLGSVSAIPATVIDPETSRSVRLTPDRAALRWKNELIEDPIPTVASVAVEPVRLPVPLLSLPLFVAAVILTVAGFRGRRSTLSFAVARLVLAAALIVGPLAEVAIALPTAVGSGPSTDSAKRILAGVLPNVYRAFEFRDEAAVYDRLALSVTGETLTDTYLEHRRVLEMEERGGARARVDAVEVMEVREIEPGVDGRFNATATWTIGGTVTHFGHRHFRQNRYEARVRVVPVDATWKIQTIEVLEEERVR